MRTTFFIIGIIALTGCATTPVSHAPIDSARAAVTRAFESGASQDEQAVPYFHAAREELANSERLARDGQGDRSRTMAMRAEADADLACTVTRHSIAQHETQEATRGAHNAEQAEQTIAGGR